MLEKSDNIAELSASLAKAQKAIRGATKDAENPFYKSRYADLSSVWEACRESLSDNGLAVIQSPFVREGDGIVGVTTMLCHASGQWVQGTVTAQPVKGDPQGVGSVITYLRRYALAAMVGVAPEDDDAEAASGRPAEGTVTRPAKPRPTPDRVPPPPSADRKPESGWVKRPAPDPHETFIADAMAGFDGMDTLDAAKSLFEHMKATDIWPALTAAQRERITTAKDAAKLRLLKGEARGTAR